jgi:hypothetical protein
MDGTDYRRRLFQKLFAKLAARQTENCMIGATFLGIVQNYFRYQGGLAKINVLMATTSFLREFLH